VRAAVGLEADEGSVRLLLPDDAGRLHLAWPADQDDDEGTRRSALRRRALRTKVPMHTPADDLSGMEVLIQPLVCRGTPVGVLEVEAPRTAFAARGRTLDAVAGLVAVVIRNIQNHVESPLRERERVATLPSFELGLVWTAHELRTPLLAARAAIDRALGTPEGERGRIALLQESSAELQRLAESIEPLLRLAAGEGTVRPHPTTLKEEVLKAIQERPQEIDPRRVSIIAAGDPSVFVDGSLVRHAIANIIINALAYSTPGSRVRVSIEDAAPVAAVRVVNRGPGIRKTEQQTLFEPLVRGRALEGATTRRGVGQHLGLGLSIARRVVELHGGVIWWRSAGGHTTFCIELPIEHAWERSGTDES
jgi:signal transduction histidine kinase